MPLRRLTFHTDDEGNIVDLPKLPPGIPIEILLDGMEQADSGDRSVRIPHPDIFGKIQILGDIIHTLPEEEWLSSE